VRSQNPSKREQEKKIACPYIYLRVLRVLVLLEVDGEKLKTKLAKYVLQFYGVA